MLHTGKGRIIIYKFGKMIFDVEQTTNTEQKILN